MIGAAGSMKCIGVLAVIVLGAAVARPAAAQKAAPPAAAKDDATCEILEIKASNEADEIDPALKPLARKLKKPPFSAWKRFSLLKKHQRVAAKMKAVDVDLVPGGKLSLLYRELSAGKKPRLRLQFTLDDKTGKRLFNGTVNLDAGDYSLIGGEPLEDDATYILGVTCKV
jgi:hypothetical protein